MTDNTAKQSLAQWIGRSETHDDLIDARQARLMQTTLDRAPSLKDGDPLPPLWHWLYFAEATPLSELSRDGHAKRGGFLPPVPLPRRMWAGGRLGFVGDLILGERARKTSTIQTIVFKDGRSGPLCFVTVRHELSGPDAAPRLWEEHDIVYRQDPGPDDPRPIQVKPPQGAVITRSIVPSSVMLFRYSALTFNGHRIHYDKDYCRQVEGYPGLVFHGPLTATLLADLAVEKSGEKKLKGFSFRATAPLFDTAPFPICAKKSDDSDLQLWAETPEGGLAMEAKATFS